MIHCLHGFLGQGSDWSILEWQNFWDCESPSLFSDGLPFPGPRQGLSLWDQAKAFNRWVSEHDPEPLLVGYSYGGRLGLHALLESPGLYRAAVLISTHPGLESASLRNARWEQDQAWAARFESPQDWNALVGDWNNQPVLKTSLERPRPEGDFDRRSLAAALRFQGLGCQDPLWLRLGSLRTPVLWMAGEQDPKYAALAQRACEQSARGQVQIVENAGHRVPWDGVNKIRRPIESFLLSQFRDRTMRNG